MSEKKHEHHHQMERENQDTASRVVYSDKTTYEKAMEKEKHHKRMGHLGELGAVAAGPFELYGKHEVKNDPVNAHRHKIEEAKGATAAVGSGTSATADFVHEHQQKKESKTEAEEGHGKKHHHSSSWPELSMNSKEL